MTEQWKASAKYARSRVEGKEDEIDDPAGPISVRWLDSSR